MDQLVYSYLYSHSPAIPTEPLAIALWTGDRQWCRAKSSFKKKRIADGFLLFKVQIMQYILVTISNTRLQKNLQLWVSSEKRFGELVAHIEEGKKLVIKPLDVSRSYVDHLLVFPTLDPAYLLKELAHKPELLTPFVVWMAKLLRIVSNSYLDGRDAVWITEVLGNHRKEAIYVD